MLIEKGPRCWSTGRLHPPTSTERISRLADCPEHERCRALLDRWRRQTSAWYRTWGILYGFLRVVTHPRVLPHPWAAAPAWEFVDALLAAPALGMLRETDRHAAVLADMMATVPQLTGNLLSAAHIAALMRDHGIKTIYTRDADFHRFPFLEVRDPLR